MKKKILSIAILGLITLPALAQQMVKTADKTSIAVKAGINFQNINGKDAAGNELENDLTTGLHAGITGDISVGSGFYIQPGALYTTKGAEFSNDVKVKLSYIEVPINFLYKPILGSGNMLLGFGPYVAFGINGSIKNGSGNKVDIDFGSSYNAGDPASYFKSFDAGANLLAGYEFANKFLFQLNAQLGLAKINKDSESITNDKTSWKNTGFGVSLGYRFN